MDDYQNSAKVVRQTFMAMLPAQGEIEALAASKRMAEWLGVDAQVAEAVAVEWQRFQRGELGA